MHYSKKVVIFDGLESQILIDYIVKPLGLCHIVFDHNKINSTNYFQRTTRLCFLLYVYLYIKINRINCVISFRDNGDIQWLSKILTSVNCYSIQNGNRTKRELIPSYGYGAKKKLYLTNYFSFGDYEKKIFNEFGHTIKNSIPVGSLRASVYKDKSKIENKLSQYDVCFVSMWREQSFDTDDKVLSYESKQMKKVDSFLFKYIRDTGKSICICSRTPSGIEHTSEYKYYRNLFGSGVEFIERSEFSTYNAMSKSKLIISSHSTCTSEAFGWGKKALYVDFSKDNVFSYYDEKILVLKNCTYEEFARRVNNIINMNDLHYKNMSKDYSNFVMRYDSLVPTYVKIQNEIKRRLDA